MCTARLEQAQHVAVDLPCRPAGLSSGTGFSMEYRQPSSTRRRPAKSGVMDTCWSP